MSRNILYIPSYAVCQTFRTSHCIEILPNYISTCPSTLAGWGKLMVVVADLSAFRNQDLVLCLWSLAVLNKVRSFSRDRGDLIWPVILSLADKKASKEAM